jgi:hypothetical protein
LSVLSIFTISKEISQKKYVLKLWNINQIMNSILIDLICNVILNESKYISKSICGLNLLNRKQLGFTLIFICRIKSTHANAWLKKNYHLRYTLKPRYKCGLYLSSSPSRDLSDIVYLLCSTYRILSHYFLQHDIFSHQVTQGW